MLLGVVADDFTGAGDIANTLKVAGMATTLVCGVPKSTVIRADAIVVALKTRSIPAGDAIQQSLDALSWLKSAGCRQIVFKYCSTFDSTPFGNIGPVAVALANALEARKVIFCPAFPANGRTVYQGHLFVNSKLLSESGMERHPLNPMTDSNIKRWLQLQCQEPVGLINRALVHRGAAAVRQALDDSSERLFIADAIDNDDLLVLGSAVSEAALITGGSGIALGLPENFRKKRLLAVPSHTFLGADGSCAILAGSCSQATLLQISRHKLNFPALQIQAVELMSDRAAIAKAVAFAARHRDELPLIYSSDTPDIIGKAQETYGKDRLAHETEKFFGELARELVKIGFARMVVAGGETSGAVVSALGLSAFEIGPEIAPGVPCLWATIDTPLAIALKSGNFGDASFFERASRMLLGAKS